MNWKQSAMLGMLGGSLVALFTRVTFSVAPLPNVPSVPAPGVPASAALTAEIDRLHDRLRLPVIAVQSVRNPFTYALPGPAGPAFHPRIATGTPAGANIPSAPVRPPFSLVGLAEDDGPDGPSRTAIVKGPAGLQFVKPGDALGPYRVTAVGEAAVELAGGEGAAAIVLEFE